MFKEEKWRVAVRRTLQLTFTLLLVFPVLAEQSKLPQQASGTATSNVPALAENTVRITPPQIFSRARPSVVIIVATSQKDQSKALGSGFVVNHNTIVTNHHVLEGMNEAYVLFSDGEVKPVSKVVADSTQQDLIILTTQTGNRPALTFGDELSLQQGDPVYALGAPKGLELSFTNGIVSSFRKSDAQFLIQTTAAIAPGSSGGPLFDRAGRVVGVTTSMISDAPGIYFSVGIGDVKRLLRTPQPVLLPLGEWAKQQAKEHASEVPDYVGPNEAQNKQDATPSVEETLSWMGKFSAVHGRWLMEGVVSTPDLVTAFPSQRCSIGVVKETSNARLSDVIDLSKINPEAITARRAFPPNTVPQYYAVFIDTSSSPYYKIKRAVVWGDGSTKDTWQDVVFIEFDSEENAERFATALKHAATLCGAKASPF